MLARTRPWARPLAAVIGPALLAAFAIVMPMQSAATTGSEGTETVRRVLRATKDTALVHWSADRSFGRVPALPSARRGVHTLMSFPTDRLDASAEVVSVSVCFTVLRSRPTRVVAYSAPRSWDEATTWRQRPRAERRRLAASAFRVRNRQRVCLPLPVSAVEKDATEVRLSATRARARLRLAARESRRAGATLVVTQRRKPKPAPTPSPPPTPSPSPAPSPAPSPSTSGAPMTCAATLTSTAGVAWRSAECQDPGYTNHLLPASPVINARESALLQALPGAILNVDEYTEPVHYASADQPLRSVTCVSYGCVGGSSAPVTGLERVAPGSDGQLVVVDMHRRRSYEMWQVRTDEDGTVRLNGDGSVTVGSMSVVDLDGRGNSTADGRPLNITGSGVSRLFGLIRAHEIKAAATAPATAIPHALQVSLPMTMNCSAGFREPATKTDGRATSSDCVQEGARVRMDPTYDCTGVATRMGQAVCHAMQRYGAYVADNNGSRFMVVYAQQRTSWPSADADYASAGIHGDYSGLGIPMSRLRSLATWSGF